MQFWTLQWENLQTTLNLTKSLDFIVQLSDTCIFNYYKGHHTFLDLD